MKDLVFLESIGVKLDAFTTSHIIAQYAQVQHHTITRLLRNHEKDFASLGKLGYLIQPSQDSVTGQSEKIYLLNEQQATLLITYLKNTEPVRAFKKELVKQFYAMRKELSQREAKRQEMKPTRKTLNDVIRELPESPHKRWAYKQYTDLAYKAALGSTAGQIRKDRQAAPQAKAVDFMTACELAKVEKAEQQIAVLLELGQSYQEIRSLLLQGKKGVAPC